MSISAIHLYLFSLCLMSLLLKVDGRGVLLDIAAKGGWHNVQRYLWLIEGARDGVQLDPDVLAEARQLLT